MKKKKGIPKEMKISIVPRDQIFEELVTSWFYSGRTTGCVSGSICHSVEMVEETKEVKICETICCD